MLTCTFAVKGQCKVRRFDLIKSDIQDTDRPIQPLK